MFPSTGVLENANSVGFEILTKVEVKKEYRIKHLNISSGESRGGYSKDTGCRVCTGSATRFPGIPGQVCLSGRCVNEGWIGRPAN